MEILGGKLLSGMTLRPGDTLVSVGGLARLHYQHDGNLVVYLKSAPLWSSKTDGHSAGSLRMQRDGDLTIFDASGPYASTQTNGHPGAMVQLQDDGNFVVYEDPNGPLAGKAIWASSTGEFVVDSRPEVPGDVPRVSRPLVGPLRIENKLFRDDSGYRRVFFCSWFPALRILRDDPGEFERQLNSIVTAGYQGIRIFLAVGGWSTYWDGREVAPITFQKWHHSPETGFHRPASLGAVIQAWPDYNDLLRTFLRACRARGLRLHVSTGDMQIICPDAAGKATELDLHRRLARICAEEGGTDVIAVAGDTNEFPINRYAGDSSESIEQMGRIIRIWEDAIPSVLTMMGAIPANEEPASLEKASTHGDVCCVHVSRDPFELCLKHTLGLVYWEGQYRAFPKPFWEGEPPGPGAESFARVDEPRNLVAVYAMHALTGQASVRFQGAAVRSLQPLESEWGFTELPAIMDAHIPEDVATWPHGSNRHGGIEYWWSGKRFITALADSWDPAPPQPIRSWTLYQGDREESGTGMPPRKAGMITGEFV